MPIELTHLSAAEYEHFVYGNMTPAMAVDHLRNGQIIMRSFADTLKESYTAPDLLPRLTDFFLKIDPEASPQSVSRKIRNWLSGKNNPSGREDLFTAERPNHQLSWWNGIAPLGQNLCISA